MRGGSGSSGSGFSRNYWGPRSYKNIENKNNGERQHLNYQRRWGEQRESSNSSEHDSYRLGRGGYVKQIELSPKCESLIEELKSGTTTCDETLAKLQDITREDFTASEQAVLYYNVAEHVKKTKGDTEAIEYYKKSLELDPKAEPKIWSELAKYYTDREDKSNALRVIKKSLMFINHSDPSFISNIIKIIKIASGFSLEKCYKIMKFVQDGEISKYWKVFTVIAKIEAENGNIEKSRLIYQYLVSRLKSLGPTIYEWIRTEQSHSTLLQSFHVCCLGSIHASSYGPIWFEILDSVMRMFTNISGLTTIYKCVDTALAKCSNEISWKLNIIGYESALMYGDDIASKHYFEQALLHVPEQLIWRIHYIGVHVEMAKCVGNYDWTDIENISEGTNKFKIPETIMSKLLVMDSCSPSKFQSECVLLKSRVYEYFGWVEEALRLLDEAINAYPDEWKLIFEKIVVLRRTNNIKRAIEVASQAVKMYPRAGRLWALYISLSQVLGDEKQFKVILDALKYSPKSGEVWCEMARFKSNPLNPRYSLRSARKAINNAIRFTPQYGDTFIEGMKITILDYGFMSSKLNDLVRQCVQIQPNYGFTWSYCKLPLHGAGFCDTGSSAQTPSNGILFVATGLIIESIDRTISYYSMAQDRRDTINKSLNEDECTSPSAGCQCNIHVSKCSCSDIPSTSCNCNTNTNTNVSTSESVKEIHSTSVGKDYFVSEMKAEKFRKDPLIDSPAGRYIKSRFRGYAFNSAIARFDLVLPLCNMFREGRWVVPEGERFRLIFPNFNIHMFGI